MCRLWAEGTVLVRKHAAVSPQKTNSNFNSRWGNQLHNIDTTAFENQAGKQLYGIIKIVIGQLVTSQ